MNEYLSALPMFRHSKGGSVTAHRIRFMGNEWRLNGFGIRVKRIPDVAVNRAIESLQLPVARHCQQRPILVIKAVFIKPIWDPTHILGPIELPIPVEGQIECMRIR